MSYRPDTLNLLGNLPHSLSGPSMRWRDGIALYHVEGVRVPPYVVMHPEQITVDKIHEEPNAEVRRVMIEQYGRARYVRDAQWECINESLDSIGQPRRLLRRDGMLLVEMTNSTIDADGTRRVYYRFVNPELRPLPDPEEVGAELGQPQALTAHNAIASTFGMRGEDYHPAVET